MGELRDHLHFLIGAVHVDPLHKIHGGGEELHHAGVIAVQPEDEVSGEQAQQPVQQGSQEVQQEVHGGQGEHIAHHEGH